MQNQVVIPDNIDHVVKTTQQWNEVAVANWVIPRGCLCIELVSTPHKQTKIKVGEGNKYYHQLPYVGGDGELSNYYTKEEVDNIIKNLNCMRIASTHVYASKFELPKSGNKLGDVRFVANPNPSVSTEPVEYLWNGARWLLVGSVVDVDMSEYVKKSEIMPRVEALEKVAHSHANKSILDQTTAAYTIPEKQKLATLKNYDDTQIKHRVSDLEEKSHTHANKQILDMTTAPFTTQDKQKLDSLHNYEPFVGTDGEYDGVEGLVPAPTASDTRKFLASDGSWKTVEAGTFDGIKDIQLSETTPGGLTVTNSDDEDYDLDVFSTLGKITIHGTQSPD